MSFIETKEDYLNNFLESENLNIDSENSDIETKKTDIDPTIEPVLNSPKQTKKKLSDKKLTALKKAREKASQSIKNKNVEYYRMKSRIHELEAEINQLKTQAKPEPEPEYKPNTTIETQRHRMNNEDLLMMKALERRMQ